MEQWKRTEDPEISLCSDSFLIFHKVAKNIYWRKDSLFFNKRCWENRIATCRKLKLHPNLSPCTKVNSK
jgi:hypothetical protein